MTIWTRVIREPMLHFVLVGAAVFAIHGATRPPDAAAPAASRTIVLSETLVAQLTGQYERVWFRSPGPEEVEDLIAAHLREEVLVREARALSLDRDDAVVRQRLAQKMLFLLEADARTETPDEATLAAYYRDRAGAYESPARVGFEQVFLGPRPRPAVVTATLDALRDGADPATLGVPSPLPLSVTPAPRPGVDGRFGSGMFDAVRNLPLNGWSGPVRSGHGMHLVRVTGRVAPSLPPLDAVRARVMTDWRRDRAEAVREARIADLLDSYEIVRPGPIPAARP